MTQRDKTAKFIDLANKRVNRVIKDLKLIANLSNRRNYEYSDEQARKIIRAIQREVENLKQAFQSGNDEIRSEFRL